MSPHSAAYDGMVWYRAHAKVSAAQAKQAATLELGPIDDVDLVWINGRAMASGFGEEQRAYAVPAKLLRAGDNVVVVNVFDMWGNGGLRGPADKLVLRFADGSTRAARRASNTRFRRPDCRRRARPGSRSPASTFSTTA